MRKIICFFIGLLGLLQAFAQEDAPLYMPPVKGTGLYSGLYKVPKNCDTGPGNFYVSTTNGDGELHVWLSMAEYFCLRYGNPNTVFSSITNMADGLANTKALMKFNYPDLPFWDIDSMGSLPEIFVVSARRVACGDPVCCGGPELCIKMNYDSSNKLIPGTNVHNMWYLPSESELMYLFRYANADTLAFGTPFQRIYGYWSSTDFNASNARKVWMRTGGSSFYPKYDEGLVRCVRKEYPYVTTKVPSGVDTVSAQCGGIATLVDGYTISARGICWNDRADPTINDHKTVNGSGAGTYNSTISGLTPGRVYYVRSYITVTGGVTVYGQQEKLYTCGAKVNATSWKSLMCHNLGADETLNPFYSDQVDGDLYQWGRPTDGHEKISSNIIYNQSSTYVPGHNQFIYSNTDWLSTGPGDDRWGETTKAANDPCPNGYKVPTQAQWAGIVNPSYNSFSSFDRGYRIQYIFLPAAGYRDYYSNFYNIGTGGYYWSSSVNGVDAYYLYFDWGSMDPSSIIYRASGCSVRCIAQ